MNLEERIRSFAQLGKVLRTTLDELECGKDNRLGKLISSQHLNNPWFTPQNVSFAIKAIADQLTEEKLRTWTDMYPELKGTYNPFTVGLIMAGNIPLVGFHDFLTVLITGNNLKARASSRDHELIHYIKELLCEINNEFDARIVLTEGTITGFDVVIATGSDNSSRYFEYYFGKYPNIIRKNRNSIAILEGDETDAELVKLGTDIFSYFGLGCRNVSKIFCPEGYDIKSLFSHWSAYESVVSHIKYANNYDFNKAVYIVNREPFLDSGYLLMKEDPRISSPVSVLYYEYFTSQYAVKQQTELQKDKIQCIIGKNYIPFGDAQWPHLWDYADGTDTIDFLLKKNIAGIL